MSALTKVRSFFQQHGMKAVPSGTGDKLIVQAPIVKCRNAVRAAGAKIKNKEQGLFEDQLRLKHFEVAIPKHVLKFNRAGHGTSCIVTMQ